MTSIMTLFVTETMRIDVIWAGIALGVAAGLEVPALVLIGRLSLRFSSLRLITTGCVTGIAYYVAMASSPGRSCHRPPTAHAWCFAAMAGVGLTLFQQMIPRPGLSTGLYMNTRRVGAIVSGPIIAFGSTTALGNRGISLACGPHVLALAVVAMAARQGRRPRQPTCLDRCRRQAGSPGTRRSSVMRFSALFVIPPTEHPERVEGEPRRRLTRRHIDLEPDSAGVATLLRQVPSGWRASRIP